MDDQITFPEGVDAENVKQEISKSLNTLYSYLTKLVSYRYYLLIYRLIKRGHVSMDLLAEDTGYSRQRLYEIVDTFEKKEGEQA